MQILDTIVWWIGCFFTCFFTVALAGTVVHSAAYMAAWLVRVVLQRPPRFDKQKLHSAAKDTSDRWEPDNGDNEWYTPEDVRWIIRQQVCQGIRRYIWLHDTVPENPLEREESKA